MDERTADSECDTVAEPTQPRMLDSTRAMSQVTDVTRTRPAEAEVPHRVGRFVVIKVLGAGAMGVVYSAYDEKLDRRVAIKVLRAGRADEEFRQRMLREARALAKLSHPNVVQVYEAAVDDDLVYIAMELIQGRPLERWQEQQSLDWRQILAAHVQAGRGLAAAHAAGLVHRDYKPHNVIVGDDGRVRVLDFGLVRRHGEEESESASSGERAKVRVVSDEAVTHVDALLGTPAYMAPEQFMASATTARSDQFSYCVAVWEGLFGVRPHLGRTLADLEDKVQRADQAEVPPQSAVPASVVKALRRGLAAEPEGRWPDMGSLLAALDLPAPRARLQQWLTAGLVASLGLALGTLAWNGMAEEDPCAGADHAVQRSWNPTVREEIRHAMLETGVPFASRTADQVVAALDDYSRQWSRARREACRDTRIEHVQSDELMDLSMACLDARLEELRATVAILREADATVVANASEAALGLGGIQGCLDAELLRAGHRPPESAEDAAEARRLEAELARTFVLGELGRIKDALELAESLEGPILALQHPPLTLRWRSRKAVLLVEAGFPREAGALMEATYYDARALGLDEVSAAAAVALVSVVGDELAEPERGRWWARLAEAELRRTGDADRMVELQDNLSAVSLLEGEWDRALEETDHALDLLGEEHGERWCSISEGRATAMMKLGRTEEARALYEAVLADRKGRLGARHPKTAEVMGNLGTLEVELGRYDEARKLYDEAIAITKESVGDDGLAAGAWYLNLGNIDAMEGDLEAARDNFARSLEIHERLLGLDHAKLGTIRTNLGGIELALGNVDGALAHLVIALEIGEKALGPDHENLAELLHNLGLLETNTGKHEEAVTHLRRAVSIREQARGKQDPSIAQHLCALSGALIELDELDEGIAVAERAHEIYESQPDLEVDSIYPAQAKLSVAYALHRAGRDGTRARQLATESREVLLEKGPLAAPLVAEADKILD